MKYCFAINLVQSDCKTNITLGLSNNINKTHIDSIKVFPVCFNFFVSDALSPLAALFEIAFELHLYF